jgi:hypothetical protein
MEYAAVGDVMSPTRSVAMLIALIALLSIFLSIGTRSYTFTDVNLASQSGHTPITPQDPSTLTLALIGIGTLAVYKLLARKTRTAGADRLGDQFVSVPPVGTVCGDIAGEEPSRGAA